jgi:signal transduction histidine kinase
VLLSSLLAVVLLVSVRDATALSYSVQVAIGTLTCAFGLSAVYAWFLRAGQHLRGLVAVQLVLDQAIWTVVVYLSGGASSGATTFYGITCFIGALLGGYRGALVAAASAVVAYTGLVVALVEGWVLPPPDQPASLYTLTPRELVTSAVANALMLVAVVLLAGTLAERLRATGGQLLKAEARADQAEREAALGRLAAGLAHEIRNPLGAISGSVALLGSSPDASAEQRQLYDIIQREAARLNDLLSDMLDLANPRVPELVPTRVLRVARDVVDLAGHSGRGGTDVAVEAGGDADVQASADEAMLRQMLWNLVRNAVQASNPGDVVAVDVANVDGRAVVQIVDHGPGLSSEAKDRIFDPFYTTRSKGTGIGLAVVRRIADQHGYRIRVFDTPGGGATFSIDLGAAWSQQEPPPSAETRGWTLFPKSNA